MKKDTLIHIVTISAIVALIGLYSTKTTEVNSPDIKVGNSVQPNSGLLQEKEFKQLLDAKEKELSLLQKRLDSREEKIAELEKKLLQANKAPKQVATKPKSQAFKNFQTKSLATTYADLIEKLGLEGEDKKAFLQLAQKYQTAHMKELVKTMREEGKFVINSDNYQNLLEGSQEEEALKEFLGDDFALFEHNRKSKSELRFAQNFNKNLSQDAKLNDTQKDQLVDLLHTRKEEKKVNPSATDDIYLESAREFLNEEQYNALEKRLKTTPTKPSITVNGKKVSVETASELFIAP
ncbi:MAG: hypothetical protein NE334_13595 [Lentisphaeraceae bacterium]|nr:hypothetical protein [Lentisphaeraceae bacterium]